VQAHLGELLERRVGDLVAPNFFRLAGAHRYRFLRRAADSSVRSGEAVIAEAALIVNQLDPLSRSNSSIGRLILAPRRSTAGRSVLSALPNPVVHLELHTGTWHVPSPSIRGCAAGGRSASLLGPSPTSRSNSIERSAAASSNAGCERPAWLPYVEVARIDDSTDRARALGGSRAAPREGPRGWRSFVAAPDIAEIAIWQPKS
jgi:hypothetical protein